VARLAGLASAGVRREEESVNEAINEIFSATFT